MPHAAFYVVQPAPLQGKRFGRHVSMPHAAFYVVQLKYFDRTDENREVSMPHAAFYVVQPAKHGASQEEIDEFQCRTQHFMWCNPSVEPAGVPEIVVSMPHAAFYVVQRQTLCCRKITSRVSMPHAAFYVVQLCVYPGERTCRGFQCRTRLFMWCNFGHCRYPIGVSTVSMPHAAFYVVQPHRAYAIGLTSRSFNAARGFLCGATKDSRLMFGTIHCFNAARGFLCGGTDD